MLTAVASGFAGITAARWAGRRFARWLAALVAKSDSVDVPGGMRALLALAVLGFLNRTVVRWAAGPEIAERYRRSLVKRYGLDTAPLASASTPLAKYLGDSLWARHERPSLPASAPDVEPQRPRWISPK